MRSNEKLDKYASGRLRRWIKTATARLLRRRWKMNPESAEKLPKYKGWAS